MKVIKFGNKKDDDCERILNEFIKMVQDGRVQNIALVAVDNDGYILYNYKIKEGLCNATGISVGVELLKDRIKEECFG